MVQLCFQQLHRLRYRCTSIPNILGMGCFHLYPRLYLSTTLLIFQMEKITMNYFTKHIPAFVDCELSSTVTDLLPSHSNHNKTYSISMTSSLGLKNPTSHTLLYTKKTSWLSVTMASTGSSSAISQTHHHSLYPNGQDPNIL
jgi:hypothetical protein